MQLRQNLVWLTFLDHSVTYTVYTAYNCIIAAFITGCAVAAAHFNP